jgi:hypothetical protein
VTPKWGCASASLDTAIRLAWAFEIPRAITRVAGIVMLTEKAYADVMVKYARIEYKKPG